MYIGRGQSAVPNVLEQGQVIYFFRGVRVLECCIQVNLVTLHTFCLSRSARGIQTQVTISHNYITIILNTCTPDFLCLF